MGLMLLGPQMGDNTNAIALLHLIGFPSSSNDDVALLAAAAAAIAAPPPLLSRRPSENVFNNDRCIIISLFFRNSQYPKSHVVETKGKIDGGGGRTKTKVNGDVAFIV